MSKWVERWFVVVVLRPDNVGGDVGRRFELLIATRHTSPCQGIVEVRWGPCESARLYLCNGFKGSKGRFEKVQMGAGKVQLRCHASVAARRWRYELRLAGTASCR